MQFSFIPSSLFHFTVFFFLISKNYEIAREITSAKKLSEVYKLDFSAPPFVDKNR